MEFDEAIGWLRNVKGASPELQEELCVIADNLWDAHVKACDKAAAEGYAEGMDDSRGEWF